ncbi:MAG: hypothetical protein ACLFSA_08960, partial [Spirochaetaceae bacterium]
GARPLRAVDLCSFWYEETIRHGGKGLRPPVELFLERAGRVDREHMALPRRINRFAIRWSPEFNREGSLEYRPIVSFTDEEGHSEVYIEREMAYSTNGGALIVSNPNTGSLWYLFQSDLPQPISGYSGDGEGVVESQDNKPGAYPCCRVRSPGGIHSRRSPQFDGDTVSLRTRQWGDPR